MPRRQTRGPLDIDDPLADPPSTPPPSKSRNLAPLTPALQTQLPPSPRPRSPLSGDSASIHRPAKDFSFLLNPATYHRLDTQHIPDAFLNSPHQPSPDTPLPDLVRHGHFRLAAATAARELTTSTAPQDHAAIFSLLYVRLACLVLTSHEVLATIEAKPLGDLSRSVYRDAVTHAHLVSWELRVLVVRLQALGLGDWRRGIMGYYALAADARSEARRATGSERRVWRSRLADLGVRVGGALVEMHDLDGAARHLQSLDPHPAHQANLALLWLRIGDVPAAQACVAALEATTAVFDPDPGPRTSDILEALVRTADGNYTAAVDAWQRLHTTYPADAMVAQNLAVCLLYTGQLPEARAALESLIDGSGDGGDGSDDNDGGRAAAGAGRHAHAFHALTFNLSTLYELCSERAREHKVRLAERVAATAPRPEGWERGSAEFKL
ncbi:hypothetical protein B0A49_09343 [Cryomyces minteri]|uniref:Trafficking protein particle complex subunit 12 n=1 Tax=Cryomyces minteri TaxID=331657 RepID=A0A4V5NDB2_9PEZI|nr:hypothetical protein B0A49_09343 [Cryomyces minteri]